MTDGGLQTWEYGSVSLGLPSATDYLAVWVRAVENICDDGEGVEFDGHYADDITLTVIPEPATLLLLALGACLIRRKR